MESCGQSRSKLPIWLAILWLGAPLLACEPFWSAPETRAKDFIEALVLTPNDAQRLREAANHPLENDARDLVADLSARVGLEFLRARHAQGVGLKFASERSRPGNDTQRTVTVNVAYLEPGTPTSVEVRFLVRLERDAQGRWRVSRVTGDN